MNEIERNGAVGLECKQKIDTTQLLVLLLYQHIIVVMSSMHLFQNGGLWGA